LRLLERGENEFCYCCELSFQTSVFVQRARRSREIFTALTRARTTPIALLPACTTRFSARATLQRLLRRSPNATPHTHTSLAILPREGKTNGAIATPQGLKRERAPSTPSAPHVRARSRIRSHAHTREAFCRHRATHTRDMEAPQNAPPAAKTEAPYESWPSFHVYSAGGWVNGARVLFLVCGRRRRRRATTTAAATTTPQTRALSHTPHPRRPQRPALPQRTIPHVSARATAGAFVRPPHASPSALTHTHTTNPPPHTNTNQKTASSRASRAARPGRG
jgi:hypothetical protein